MPLIIGYELRCNYFDKTYIKEELQEGDWKSDHGQAPPSEDRIWGFPANPPWITAVE